MMQFLTYTQMKILAWVIMIGGFLFWMVFARRWSKSIDEYFDSPEYNLPSEITIEMVKEKPQAQVKQSASQTAPSSLPSSAQALSSEPLTPPKGTAGYVPE